MTAFTPQAQSCARRGKRLADDESSAAVAFCGAGPRRWRWLARAGTPAAALPLAAVQDRMSLQLPETMACRAAAQTALTQIESWLRAGLAVAGFIGYEIGAALEGQAPQAQEEPLPDLAVVAFHPEHLQPCALPTAPAHGSELPIPHDLSRQQRAYESAVADALERIGAGEIYQVNLSVQANIPTADLRDLPPLALLAAVQAAQPVPFGMYVRGDAFALLCGSMERFLTVQDGQVRSRPIKGTAPRDNDPATDADRARQLIGSQKECAENTMIVDMVRNDLRRASRPASVSVPTLLACVPYATVWHLESEVQAALADPAAVAQWLAATLPPASVTGCPKVQAMKVIAQLEGRRRGPYCGAAGLWLPDGSADLSVGIRQLVLRQHCAQLSVGAGIVADSHPHREWLELCWKARSGLRLLGAIGAGVTV